MNEEYQRLAQDKVNCLTASSQYTSDPEKLWWTQLSKDEGGVKLEVKGYGPDYETSISDAVDKWKRITSSGIKEFNGPMITYTPPAPFFGNDDDIPF